MKNEVQLNEKWLKASVIGTIWAASEIILGGFLHNLRVPFAGSLLTAIGVILLISISYIWKENGIFWRAGLICALMKTMSPSAVIFGPMIAIFAESLILEFSVKIFGKTYLGFILGAVLAVSWSFAQKISNMLIFYGFNIVELYKSLIKYAEGQLNIQFDTFWIPIFTLLSVYIVIGLIAAFIGIKTGKKIVSQPLEFKALPSTDINFAGKTNLHQSFNYSFAWLVINMILIVGSLLCISLLDWKIWVMTTVVFVMVWVFKYKRALRQLSKPKFWLFFIAITMLTALVFTKMQSKSMFDAVLIGMEMNFRATVLIIGFSVLGTELYNPKVRGFFAKTKFKNLPSALELSAESLPYVIVNIPEIKVLLSKPAVVMQHLISFAEHRFNELKTAQTYKTIIILTGKIDVGKTSFILQLIEVLKQKQLKVSGIYSRKIYQKNERIGYDVVDIKTNTSEPFLRINTHSNSDGIGMFKILPRGLQLGINSLAIANSSDSDIVIVDEIGRLELSGKGWMNQVRQLVALQQTNLLLVINENFIEELSQHLNIKNKLLIKVPDDNLIKTFERIIRLMECC